MSNTVEAVGQIEEVLHLLGIKTKIVAQLLVHIGLQLEEKKYIRIHLLMVAS
jgi:hypothetical protein